MRASILILAIAALSSGCAHLPPDEPSDPLEPVNRGIYRFNRVADTYVLRPVAKGYQQYTPAPVRIGVHNFIDNLFYPTTVVNAALQGKFVQSGRDLGRFVVNSTVGLVGLMDVATPLGLQRNDEDFGQTLGKWGLGEGWYLMLPLFGPSNGRDLVGKVADSFTGPTPMGDLADAYTVTNYHVPNTVDYALTGVGAIDKRVSLLKADRVLDEQLDPYVFIRTIYLQNRQNKVYDGNPPKQKFSFEADE